MIVDKFTKFILSIIAIFLCLNALNPWLSPPLVNAEPSQFSQLNSIDRLALFDLIEVVGKWAKFEVEDHQQKRYTMPDKTLEDAVVSISKNIKIFTDIEKARFGNEQGSNDS